VQIFEGMQHIQLIFAIFIGVFVTVTVTSSECRFPGVVGMYSQTNKCFVKFIASK
jgi:hypothetical protein